METRGRKKGSIDRSKVGRNAEVLRLAQEGKLTLREIGEKFGFSRQRTFQIVGVSSQEALATRMAVKKGKTEVRAFGRRLARKYLHFRIERPWACLFNFWSKVSRPDKKGCWNWEGGINNSLGGNTLGRLQWKFGTEVAARFAWECFLGNIPDKLVVHHTCENFLCCNPAHMELRKACWWKPRKKSAQADWAEREPQPDISA
jgi:hypothetical protein